MLLIKGITTVVETDPLVGWIFGGLFLFFILIIVIMNVTYKHKPTKEIEGVLVRKKIDKGNDVQYFAGSQARFANRRYLHYIRFLTFQERDPDPSKKYYVTFRTKDGVKSFTVHYDTFLALKIKSKGIITHKGSKFISFKVKK